MLSARGCPSVRFLRLVVVDTVPSHFPGAVSQNNSVRSDDVLIDAAAVVMTLKVEPGS